MTEADLSPRHWLLPGSPGLAARPPLTLAEEHVPLLLEVTASTEKLLAAPGQGRGACAELAALAGRARAEVLRQVSDEEALLFPAVPSQEGWPGITRGCAPALSYWSARPPGSTATVSTCHGGGPGRARAT